MKRKKKIVLLALLVAATIGVTKAYAQKTIELDSVEIRLRSLYTKREVMIPMRDGISLYTAIYEPKNNKEKHPILMNRTPYSCAPYGEKFRSSLRGALKNYVDNNYILVFQDVRGRHKSEGEFVQVRPLNKNKKKKNDIDEGTDTYDTIEWLIHNTKNNNGNVGAWGISYDGFYATMAASSAHPALKAVSPQGPVTDWFRGDDRHHNGAFTLLQTTNFLPSLEGRNIGVGVIKQIVKNDVYTDFLSIGTFKDINKLVNDTTPTLWNMIAAHPNFDEFWQERDARRSCYNLKPAILVVGGLFDSEDCYGAWNTYKAIKEQSPETELYLAFGPWWHGAWSRHDFQGFGNIYFGNNRPIIRTRLNILSSDITWKAKAKSRQRRFRYSTQAKTNGRLTMNGRSQMPLPHLSICTRTERSQMNCRRKRILIRNMYRICPSPCLIPPIRQPAAPGNI